MYVIALLLAITAPTQTLPPDEPPPLEPGEKSYLVVLTDDDSFFGIGKNVDIAGNSGRFREDSPFPERPGTQMYEFEKIDEEKPEWRAKRWKELVAAWRIEHGYVQTDFANDSKGWVTQAEAEWSDRARAAALSVIEKRQLDEVLITKTPAATEVASADEEQPGLLELWGPQTAVGILGLILMGVVARALLFSGESGWQKIE